MTCPPVYIHSVSADGAVATVSANPAYSQATWNRNLSEPGMFTLTLAPGAWSLPWPGRYLVTADGREEVGVIEKVSFSEDGSDRSTVLSGRFAECLWSRYELGAAGAVAEGANWRQAVTAALGAWHMPDLPELSFGEGTQAATGSSYRLAGEGGDAAADVIYSCCYANGSRPLVTYDRASGMSVLLRDGLDRTRGQSANPIAVFSLRMGSALSTEYNGDFSTQRSQVLAHAEKGSDPDRVAVDRTLAVPGFDASAMWAGRSYEDVSSLIGQDADPTAALVDAAGALRAYDHAAEVTCDCKVGPDGYRGWWDLGDLVEVEVEGAGVSGTARVEECRETWEGGGVTVDAAFGSKRTARRGRAGMGRR